MRCITFAYAALNALPFGPRLLVGFVILSLIITAYTTNTWWGETIFILAGILAILYLAWRTFRDRFEEWVVKNAPVK